MTGEELMAIFLRNARIIDGKGEVLDHGYVVVDGNRIESTGKGGGPKKKNAGEEIDLEGRTLLPGMIDCHVHLCLDGSPDPTRSLQNEPDSLITLKAAKNAQLTLLAGVTTVRDMGARNYVDISLREAIQMGITLGPHVLCSGQLICMTGGQGWPFGREADGADEVRRAVREQLKAGANLIKLMATGGVLTPGIEAGAPQLTYEELKAGVEEAHKAGRKAASHAQGNEGIKNSLKAGIDTIEHGIDIDEETIDLFLKQKVALVPTISAPFHILEKGGRSGIPDFIIEKTKKVKTTHIASAQKAYKAGVSIGMGTDAGTPFNMHGENLKELELMMQLGFTAMEAIIAATQTAAGILGRGGQIGTIEEGKLADLIVVEGDPLKDIKILQNKNNIVAIMKDGHFFKKLI